MKFIGISAAGLLLSSTASPVASAASNTSLRGRFEKDVSSPVLKERNLGYSFGEECVCAPGYDSECTPKCDPVDKLCKPGEELDCIYHEKWDLDDEEVPVKIGNMRVNDPVGSYWTVDFTPSNGENNFVPAWCVDVGRGLSNQNWIEADLYSSYSKNIPNDQDDPRKRAVDKLKFLPAINYLLNAEDLQPGQTVPSNICPGAPTISWSDFQKAVWQLIDNQDTSFAGLKQSQMDECVYNYITTRGSSKFDYEPKCGDKLGVLVIVDRSNDVIYKQVIIAVVDDAPCTECPDGCIDYESFQKDEHPVHIEDGRLLGKASSYWRVDLNLTDGIEAYHETWCVDKDRSLSPSYRDADIYSIYDDTIDPAVLEEAVEEYQNLPAVNFLVNYFEQGQTVGTCGVAITWREMQSAIWSLVESPGDNTAISGYDSCSAAYMKWYALEHGADYVPTCYEPMLVLVIIDRDNGDIRKQVIASLVTPDCDECTEPVCDPDVCELIPYDNSHGPGLHDDCYSISNDINPNFYSDCQDGLWCVGQWGGIWGQAKCFPAGEFGDGGHSKPWNYDEYAPVPSNPLPTQYVPLDCAIDNSVDCPSKNNLGPLLLGDLPPEQYDVIKAHAQSTLTATGASVVVGGDFHSIIGAEVEGLAVVLGDLVIEKYGAHSWCRAGVGSGVGPSADDYCLIVGGNVQLNRDFESAFTRVIGGIAAVSGAVSGTGGFTEQYANGTEIDIVGGADVADETAEYDDLIDDIADKSAYWATLYPNGVVVPALMASPENPGKNVIIFEAGDDNCLQVFHLSKVDFGPGIGVNVKFGESLRGKTILINVASDEANAVTIDKWGDFIDYDNVGSHLFDPVLKASILWNFYDATHVTLGLGTGGPEMPGSVIVPNGSLDFGWSGHSGRLVVGQDLILESAGCELHNYDFIPPCPLPLPPCTECPEDGTPPVDDRCDCVVGSDQECLPVIY